MEEEADGVEAKGGDKRLEAFVDGGIRLVVEDVGEEDMMFVVLSQVIVLWRS